MRWGTQMNAEKLPEKALSQQEFRNLGEASGDLVYSVDQRGVLDHANRAALELVHHTLDELRQRPSLELVPAEHRKHVQQALLRQMLKKQPLSQLELPVQIRSGGTRWLEQHALLLEDERGVFRGFQFVARDISARKESERKLQRTLSQLAAILDATHEGILAVNNEGKVLLTNERFREMWQLPEALLALKDDDSLLSYVANQTTEPEAFLRRVKDLYQNLNAEVEDLIRFKDGRVYERSTRPQRVRGVTEGRIWSFRDVTERNRLYAQMLRSHKMESLGVLAGGIAHDFNNLLTSILGNTEVVMQELPADSPLRETLALVHGAVYRATDLTRQMLHYSGQARIQAQPLLISGLLQELRPLLNASMSKEGQLRFKLASSERPVQGDPAQLRQVFSNLLVNAAEAIGDGSGEISVSIRTEACSREELGKVHLGENLREGNYTIVEVADTGCGMSQDVQKQLFDPLFSTKFTGRGLGMASVLGILRAHRGGIEVDSAPGEGTRVQVYLPSASGAQELTAPAGPLQGAKQSGNGVMLLVVDDEVQVRRITQRVLEKANYEVLTAVDGVDALEVFGAHADEIKAVLLDVSMPRMNGKDALRELRRQRAELPVVLTSGYNREEVFDGGECDESTLFIQKPYSTQDLLAMIDRALQGVV